jgi:hypothetical protein
MLSEVVLGFQPQLFISKPKLIFMKKINTHFLKQKVKKDQGGYAIRYASRFIIIVFLLINHQLMAQSGAALNFDGVDDRIDLGTTIGNFGTGNFTVETWFKSTTTGDKTIFGKRVSCNSGSFWNLRLINGALYFEVYGTANVSAISPLATYNDGNWHHVACVRNNNTYTLYVDGAQKAQNVTGVGLAAPYNYTNAASLYIGSGHVVFSQEVLMKHAFGMLPEHLMKFNKRIIVKSQLMQLDYWSIYTIIKELMLEIIRQLLMLQMPAEIITMLFLIIWHLQEQDQILLHQVQLFLEPIVQQ